MDDTDLITLPSGGSTGKGALHEPSPDPTRDARFTTLYDAYYHRILGYARRRTSPDDAVDLVAETFSIAWRRLDDVPRGDEALYWLYATARRVLANHRRAELRRANLTAAIGTELALATSPAASIESQRLAAAFERLREDERELLLLIAWEGLDMAAAAAVLRCSPNACRIRLHRTRRRLAHALAAVDDDAKDRSRSGHGVTTDTSTSTLELEESL